MGGRRVTVPAARMKMRREHRVLLRGRAVEILVEPRGFGGGGRLVFTVGDGKPMSKNRLRRKLQMGAVPHGFCSSFRDWAAEETDHPREVVEAALAHMVRNKVEAAYRRTDCSSGDGDSWKTGQAYLAGEDREPEPDSSR